MARNITFEQLKTIMRERAGTDGLPNVTSIPNAVSALNAFLGALELTEKAVIGDVLRDSFSASITSMIERMRSEELEPAHIKNRRSAMQHWNRLVRSLDHEDAVRSRSNTPFQKRLRELHESLPPRSKVKFYRSCGLSRNTVLQWLDGKAPRIASYPNISTLEERAELSAGTLLGLLPYNRHWEYAKRPDGDMGPKIEYRERMVNIRRDRQNHPDRIPLLLASEEWTVQLREEWRGLLSYKTSIELSTSAPSGNLVLGALRSAMAAEHKSVRKQWRLRPQADYPQTHEPWVADIGGFRVTTAIVMFGQLSSFLGWARQPLDMGGKGMNPSTMTLGLVTDVGLIREYIEWRTVRAGAVNQGIATFLNQMGMLVHEQTGYLPKHPEIGQRVGVNDPVQWRAHCAVAKKWIAQTSGNIIHLLKPTRDPAEPIRSALDSEEPLAPFIEGLRRYARHVPPREIDRSVQARDLLLLALTMTNPLRSANLRLLTYLPDNTGSFRKRRDGGWELFVPGEQFKNFRGAAKDDYYQNIDPAVWPFLEDYLQNHRQLLAPCERGLVFVADTLHRGARGSGGEELWDAIDERFRWITRSYVPGCPGVGPHAMRYIVGTSIIMHTKGDYIQAAKVLHDLPQTVHRHYAKLLQEYANRSREEVLGPVLATIHSHSGMAARMSENRLPVA